MVTSPDISKIAPALLAAQRDFKPVAKSAVNPHFKSHYASLDSVLAMAVPVLNKHGITVLQTQSDNGLCSVLLHDSGQWIHGGTLTYHLDKDNMQGLGSAVTYARRYSLGALLGIATEDDDDGNAASTTTPQQARQPRQTRTQPPAQQEEPGDTQASGDWRDVRVPVGKNKGVPLGGLQPKTIMWYVDNFQANPKYADSVAFREALDQYNEEQTGNQRQEGGDNIPF